MAVTKGVSNNGTVARQAIPIGDMIADDQLEKLEALAASQVNALSQPEKGVFSRALQMSRVINQMRSLITKDVMKHIMPLQGSKLGFRTDNDSSGGYSEDVVKECLIEAVLNGAMPCGNEFNIIASNSYLTKEFFIRRLREWPGLTDLRIELGVPVTGNGGALVECYAYWKLDGVDDSIECKKTDKADLRICVRVNNGAIVDATLGKAERKLRAKIWAKLTGSNSTVDGEVGDTDLPPNTIVVNQQREPVLGAMEIMDRIGEVKGSKELDKLVLVIQQSIDAKEIDQQQADHLRGMIQERRREFK